MNSRTSRVESFSSRGQAASVRTDWIPPRRRSQRVQIDPLEINDFKRIAPHLTLNCASLRTKLLHGNTMRETNANSFASCFRIVRRCAPHCMKITMREKTQLRNLGMPCAFFPRLHVGRSQSRVRHVRRFMSPQEGCVGSHTNDPCVFSEEEHGFQRSARSPNARGRDGEHARVAVVNAGTCGPSQNALLAPRAYTTARKKSPPHFPLPPSYTMHSQMRQGVPDGSAPARGVLDKSVLAGWAPAGAARAGHAVTGRGPG